jgi:anti-anti-sigma regulatory factor
VRPGVEAVAPNHTLPLTTAAFSASGFNASPAAAAGERGRWLGSPIGEHDVAQTGEDWTVATPVSGVYVVRFAAPLLIHPNRAAGSLPSWERLSNGVCDGGALVLNFTRVEYLSSQFLGCLLRTRCELNKRGARIVGCHLNEELRASFQVVGPRQPLDFVLNYADTEEQALEKAGDSSGPSP